MSIEAIKKLSNTYKSKEAEKAKLQEEVNRCQAASDTRDRHKGEIDALFSQKADAEARAFIAKIKANTAGLEAAIKKAGDAHGDAIRDGEAAANAIPILQEQIAAIDAELAVIKALRMDEAEKMARDEFAAGENLYKEALAKIEEALQKIVGAGKVHGVLTNSVRFSNLASLYITSNQKHLSDCMENNFRALPVLNSTDVGSPYLLRMRAELSSVGFEIYPTE
ncbi:MAG: hypothetical protein PSX71_01745 [bacterium]|nr:hypothetical protein [bacterium]